MDIKYAYYNTSKGYRVLGGTAAQFLKADGSIDSKEYIDKYSEQNIEGDKWFRSAGGNQYLNHRLRIISEDGSNPGLVFYKSGVNVGTIQYNGVNYLFTNSDTNAFSNLVSAGYIKEGSNNNFLLLGGGGHVPITEFVTNTDLNTQLSFVHKIDTTYGLNNASDTLTNKSWFDYNWAGTGRLGSVLNVSGFEGINQKYNTELFASYNQYYAAIRTKNGDTNSWNAPMVLWHDKNFNPNNYQPVGNYVTRDTDQSIDGKKLFNAYFDSYTPDGLFDSNARTLKVNTPSGQKILFGYKDYGGGQYYPRIGFTNDSSLTKWSLGPLGNDFVIGVNNNGVETFKIRPSGATSKTQNQTQIFDKVYQGYFDAGGHTGILAIKMPQAIPDQAMFSIDINIYGYESQYLGKINIAFYKYVSGLIINNGSKALFNVTENFPTNVARVGIGTDGFVSILLGQSSTFWNGYFSFEVAKVEVKYVNYNHDWSQGWSHALETDLSQYGSNIITLPTDVTATKEFVNQNLNEYWKKYSVGGYIGINAPTPFGFLNGNVAQKAYMGGLLVSDAFQDEGNIPTNGIYSNGDIISNNNIKAKYFNGNGFTSNQLNGIQVFACGNDTLYIGNTAGLQYINFETGGNDLKHFRTDLGYGVIWDAHNFNPDLKVSKSGDTMTGSLIVNSPDSIGSNNLGLLPQNTKLFLANGNTLVANYGTVFWTEATGQGFIQQQRADGSPIAYRLNLQPYGGGLFYGNNEVATVNQFQNYYTKNESLNLFVGLNGVQTIYDTKTFNSSPIIPNGTLGNHAVNLNQLNSRVNGDYLAGQIINDANNADNEHGVVFNYGTGANLPAGIGEAVLMTTSFLPNYFSNQFATDFFTGEHFLRTQQFGVWGDYYKFWSTKHFSANDITNWNISFGWGNHATAGYATTSQLFKNLLSTSDLNLISESGIYRQENPTSGFNYTTTLNLNSSDGRQQLTIERSGGGMKFRGTNIGSGNTGWSDWKDVIHSSNFSDYLNNSSQLNSKVTNLENVTGIGFSSGNADLSPYFYHPVNGYRFLATQSWVSSNYISTSHIANTITLTNIQQWNYMAQYGLQLNSDFTVNTGSGLLIADDYFGGESGMIDRSYDRFVSAKQEGYYKYGSRYGTFDGLNFNFESRLFGMGRESNKEDKLTVEGSVKASKNFKSEEERPDTIFIPNGNVASLKDEIVNDESEYAIRLDPHEYKIDPSGYLDVDDRNRLIHIIGEQVKMVVNFKEIYPKQQIVIYNFDKSGGAMTVKIYGKDIYNIEPGSFLRLYVTRSRRVIAERQLPCEFVW